MNQTGDTTPANQTNNRTEIKQTEPNKTQQKQKPIIIRWPSHLTLSTNLWTSRTKVSKDLPWEGQTNLVSTFTADRWKPNAVAAVSCTAFNNSEPGNSRKEAIAWLKCDKDVFQHTWDYESLENHWKWQKISTKTDNEIETSVRLSMCFQSSLHINSINHLNLPKWRKALQVSKSFFSCKFWHLWKHQTGRAGVTSCCKEIRKSFPSFPLTEISCKSCSARSPGVLQDSSHRHYKLQPWLYLYIFILDSLRSSLFTSDCFAACSRSMINRGISSSKFLPHLGRTALCCPWVPRFSTAMLGDCTVHHTSQSVPIYIYIFIYIYILYVYIYTYFCVYSNSL